MATITVSPNWGFDIEDFDFYLMNYAERYSRSSSRFEIDYGNGFREVMGGSGVRYDRWGLPYTGTVTSYASYRGATELVSITGFNLSAVAVSNAIWTYSTTDDANLIASALSGHDRFTGGNLADSFIGLGGNDTIFGRGGNDLLSGGTGLDQIFGGAGNDILEGLNGADLLKGEAGNDVIYGGAGLDTLSGGFGNDGLSGGADNDRLLGDAGNDLLLGDAGADSLWGDAGNDTLGGGAQNDLLAGGIGNDRLLGDAGADRLLGDAGNDTLTGGQGADQLWGGLGADRFVFLATSDSTTPMRDQILDFSRAQGDRIDLSAIDADRRDSYDNDAFRFVGTDAFSGTAGELRYGRVGNGVIVQADTNGDRVADMAFLVAGNQALLASDFLL
ncbi:hypothetical protein PY32053_01794 [Paracoccus yeei]|uniref:Peptidase M10 serralysin C-terminal domain-containing protein n=1 Tax=Paracoccus yeei TaxID=147645 RepID=A0A386ULZ7_9RHOB|nr:calcium-binding protein [Paracoccus yeei]AYF01419.1 hypothetical protein PY32053_01794 [Paracoccus yeei]